MLLALVDRRLRVDHLSVGLEEPDALAVRETLDAHAIGFLRRRVEQRDLRYVQRRFLLEDATRLVLLRVGAYDA